MERGVLDQDGQPTHLQRRSGLPLDVRCLVCGRSSEETLVVKGEHIVSPEVWAQREKQSARRSAEMGAAEARGATSEEVVKIMMRPPRMSSGDRSPTFYGLCRDDLLRAKELSTEFVNSVRQAAAAPPP